ncbi:MAG: hypothetical protein VZR06_11830, partial [Butyrivibrio sp.]|nr:hypothetical protein [Butyrivibrio sp.]
MEKINYKSMDQGMSYTAFKKAFNVAYLGGVSTSHKLDLSEKAGVLTYGLYLAPWNMSGHQVCAGGAHCHEFCLNGSGQNKIDILARGEMSRINASRIKKTQLFYQNRPLFMRILIHEIKRAQLRAKSLNMPFAVRLNCTSDLSPELFIDPETGLNILQLFPNIQFYDYTKVPNRIKLLGKYNNYDLTFSFDGYNWKTAESFLNAGGRVAVVFYKNGVLPVSFAGYKVIDGNNYDMRYMDPGACIVGLYYHTVGNDYKTVNGVRVYNVPDTPFV